MPSTVVMNLTAIIHVTQSEITYMILYKPTKPWPYHF